MTRGPAIALMLLVAANPATAQGVGFLNCNFPSRYAAIAEDVLASLPALEINLFDADGVGDLGLTMYVSLPTELLPDRCQRGSVVRFAEIERVADGVYSGFVRPDMNSERYSYRELWDRRLTFSADQVQDWEWRDPPGTFSRSIYGGYLLRSSTNRNAHAQRQLDEYYAPVVIPPEWD